MFNLKKLLLVHLTILSLACHSPVYADMFDNFLDTKDDFTREMVKGLKDTAFLALQIGIAMYIQFKILEPAGFKVYQPGEIKENFSNVGGNDEAKELFQDLVAYLKNPKVYEQIGARPTQGVLLTGSPGTGKTLLARALAGEVNCAFIYASGSEMNGKFVGSGVERIKKLFYQAQHQYTWLGNNIPCIIFIDEFEILAKQRGASFDNFSDQTVNELLTQLDGFVKNHAAPVIVIAATNYPEKIDKAILRPGRIDRVIHINTPSYDDRLDILTIHLDKVKHNHNISLHMLAQQTVGFSGAELGGIINSAARLAANKGACQVEQEDIQEAYELRVIGVASKRPLTQKEREIVAYHEAGHAIASMLLSSDKIVNKITILPRGGTLGVTHILEKEEVKRLYTKDDFLNRIAMLLAGRAAEEIMFGIVTTGPSGDLQQATELSKEMVEYYGMGNELVAGKVNEEQVSQILDEQYQRVKNLLLEHRAKLETLSDALLEKNTLIEDDIKKLCGIAA